MKTTTLIALGLSLCALPLSAQEKEHSPLDNFGRTPLMAAAHTSEADKVKELLAQGADPNEIPPQGRTALMLAAWDHSGECTRLLLEAGAALDVKTTGGKTALDIAVEQGNVAAVKLLLEAGAKPVSAIRQDKNPHRNCLLAAACHGNQEMVDLLIAHGAEADERHLFTGAASGGLHVQLKRMLEQNPNLAHISDEFNRTALMSAAYRGNIECTRILLAAGAAPDDEINSFNKTALAIAAERGHAEVVRLLLEAGASNRPPFMNAVSPLQQAVCNGHIKVVEVLLEKGVDINDCQSAETSRSFGNSHVKTDTTYLGISGLIPSISGHSDSAIMNATVFNRNTNAMLEFVLSKGADIELRNGDGTTPLMVAAMLGYRPQVQALLAAGAKVDAHDNMGSTALIHAAKSGNTQLVRDLLAAGADANATNNEGMTPLLYAVLANAPECISVLKEAGAKADAKNYAGHSAAQLAAFGGAKDILVEALQNGLDVNTSDATGHNLLAYAVMGGQADLIPFLVEKGADVNAKDDEGLTPLMHALLQKDASATVTGSEKVLPDMVAMLLERGADAKAVDNNGATALHYAVLSPAPRKQIEELVAAGADVGAKDKDGYDALTLAALFGYKVQLEKLIALGANPDVRDAEGHPLLQLVMTRYTVCKCDRLLMLGHIIAKRMSQPALLNGKTLSCRDIECMEFPRLPYGSTGDLLLANGADPWVRDKNGKLLILRYLNDQGLDRDNVIRSLISAMKNVPDSLSEREKSDVLCSLMRHEGLFRPSECHHAKPFPNPVEKLLGLGISPDVTSVDGATPLAIAARYRNYPAAKALLEHGADVNKADLGGNTPLHSAAASIKPGEDASVLRLLLAQPGINVNAQDKECTTPLLEAVRHASPATIQLLLDAGADVTATDLYDRNLLMWACSNPNPAVFKMLYDLGKVDPKATDGSRIADTLHYAVLNNRQAIIDLLLPDGVTDAEAKGFYGEQLMVNALRGHNAHVARGLLAHGVDAKTVLGYDQHRTLLHLAAQGCPELVPDFLTAGADPKAVTDHKQTVLMYAIIFGDNQAPARMNAIRALIEAGCAPDAKDDRGKTALDYATSSGHKEQVELLRRYTQSEGK